MFIFAPIILFIPTIYATIKELDRLPWGLDYIFGCREDGWNGTGCDPENIRKHWKNVDGKTIQGWYPDYLGVIWSDLSAFKRWWYSYKWCSQRNVCWNLRLTDWFGTSIHFDDIKIIKIDDGKVDKTAIWIGKDGKKRYFKRRKVFGLAFDYGYEFHFDYFNPNHIWYNRVRKEGYTFDVSPFKDRSIPSFRPRFKK
jgi:hypothetical protein